MWKKIIKWLDMVNATIWGIVVAVLAAAMVLVAIPVGCWNAYQHLTNEFWKSIFTVFFYIAFFVSMIRAIWWFDAWHERKYFK